MHATIALCQLYFLHCSSVGTDPSNSFSIYHSFHSWITILAFWITWPSYSVRMDPHFEVANGSTLIRTKKCLFPLHWVPKLKNA